MSSSGPSSAQLFYDTGRGYREEESSSAAVSSHSLADFRELNFELPVRNIRALRFDPLNTPGEFAVRSVIVWRGQTAFLRISPADIVARNQIAARHEAPGAVVFSTVPESNDSNLTFVLHERLRLRRTVVFQNIRLFLLCLALLLAIGYYASDRAETWLASGSAGLRRLADHIADRLSSDEFITFDGGAVAFYAAVLSLFAVFSLLDLNGSSVGVYRMYYHRGAPQPTYYLGSPRQTRSDEWGYVTPDIFNQCFRTDRFEVQNSTLGGHSVALTGNIPVRHFTTFFRPQFWAFFGAPFDYAFAVYWQSKSLLLLTGVFTFLLLVTRSTLWSVAGALWYYFSAFTQWTFSWPSALAEMTGSICWVIVFACYLAVGRRPAPLFLSAIGLASFAINFAMCAYPPHLIPLAYLAVFVFAGWCLANRKLIARADSRLPRVAAAALAIVLIGISGGLVYHQLHEAISAIAATTYPGKRIDRGGSLRPLLLASHLLQWTENEDHYPAFIGNMCEGSGFLWLAPLTLFCLGRMSIPRVSKYLLVGLWLSIGFWLAWLLLPVPPALARILAMDRTGGSRVLPALGLANIGIVAIVASHTRPWTAAPRASFFWREILTGIVGALGFYWLFNVLNGRIDQFFRPEIMVLAALFLGTLAALLISGWKKLLALGIVVSQLFANAAINPVQRGLGVIGSSELFQFVQSHPQLRQGKWIVFSDSVVMSGFVAATGCDVYTGTHYLPDIDHFPLFSKGNLDVKQFDRLGYLDAHLRKPNEPMKVRVPETVITEWSVSPNDSVLRDIGIRYFAFDHQPPVEALAGLEPLVGHPLDGFWLYRYR